MKIIDLPSSNFDDRGAVVDMLVLHYTGMESAEAAYRRLCDRQAKVSAHYVVEENGRVRRLVAEDKRAWHAGVAHWRGHADQRPVRWNRAGEPGARVRLPALPRSADEGPDRALPGPSPPSSHSFLQRGRPFGCGAEAQGRAFRWPRLARAGIGVWPEDDGPMADGPPRASRTGWVWISDPSATIRAFQRRYRPDAITGEMDLETETLLRRLARLTQTLESVV